MGAPFNVLPQGATDVVAPLIASLVISYHFGVMDLASGLREVMVQ